MNEKIKIILRYIRFRLSAGKAYSIHSPFVYKLYSDVFQNKNKLLPADVKKKIASIRKELYQKNENLKLFQLGGKNRKVHEHSTAGKYIQSVSVSSTEGSLLYGLVQYFKPTNVIELGTGAGIGSMYMTSADENIPLYTIEGNADMYSIASDIFKKYRYFNIHIQHGTFDEALPSTLKRAGSAQMVFIDGDHTSHGLFRYYNQIRPFLTKTSILILHDIYWSDDMQMAWKKMISLPDVTVSIDVFYFGILFFRSDIAKQHFKLKI